MDSRTNVYVRARLGRFPAWRAASLPGWPEGLAALALPGEAIPLSADMRDALIEECWRRAQGQEPGHSTALDDLLVELDRGVLLAQRESPVGAAFVRLGSRAPTDSPLVHARDMQVDSGLEALEVLLGSPRSFDDLCLAQEAWHTPTLLVRPWLPLSCEARALVRGGKVESLEARPGPYGDPVAPLSPEAREEAERFLAEVPAWPLEAQRVDLAWTAPDAGESRLFLVDLSPLA